MRRSLGLLPVVAILLMLETVACRPPVRGNGRNLLLVTFETTRADHLGVYGYGRDTSPTLDALAAQGALFERCFAASPRTNPSLASLMTSRYPHEHGVRNLLLPLEPENRTLAEILRDSGYLTAAIQTHPRLIASSGFAQGFDIYDDDFRSHPLAPQACESAARWLRKVSREERPWFLWVHLMDPHWTYDPPRPWRTRYGADDSRPARLYRDLAERRRTIGPVIFGNRMGRDEVEAFVNLYDAEIRFTDEAVGGLLRLVETLGLGDRTVVAVTSDHGESLGEHDYFFEHGDFGTEAEIHVPLLLRAPGQVPAGVRVSASTPNLDLGPTLLDLLGLAPEPDFRGASLIPLVTGRSSADRPCFGETGKRFHEENTRREVAGAEGKWRWIRRGDFKLLHVPRSEEPPLRRLYDVSSDPGETTDVKDLHPEILERLGQELDDWIAEDTGVAPDPHVTPEAMEELRALGYVN